MAKKTFGTFKVHQREVAVPIEYIQEIINMPGELSPLPENGEYLLGLIDLRGNLIPLIDLSKRLNMPPIDLPNAKVLIIVQDLGLIAVLIQSVQQILYLDESAIIQYDFHKEHQLIRSSLKVENHSNNIELLEISELYSCAAIEGDLNSSTKNFVKKQHKTNTEKLKCISFMDDKTVYSLPVTSIHEIICLKDLLGSKFQDSFCVGRFDLRGIIIPVIRFSNFLKKSMGTPTEYQFSKSLVVVLKHANQYLALLVDQILNLSNYEEADIKRLPKVNSEIGNLIKGCIHTKTLNNKFSDQLLINETKVFEDQFIQILIKNHHLIYPNATLSKMAISNSSHNMFITFHLNTLVALPIGDIQEIVVNNDSFVSSDKSDSLYLGTLNLRGKIIAVIDLHHLYELEPSTYPSNNNIIIVNHLGSKFGLKIDELVGILKLTDDNRIICHNSLRTKMSKYFWQDIKEVVKLKNSKEPTIINIIDIEKTINRILALNFSQSAS